MTDDATRTEPKPPPVDRMSLLWQRVNEHKIVQWSVAYVALAYTIQHAVILTSESFEWPGTVARVTMLLFALGLPVIVTLAWYHGHRASRHFSKAELSILSVLLVIGAFLFYTLAQPSGEHVASTAAVQDARVSSGGNETADPNGTISVAVLPFANLSSDKEQEFFSDGMTDEIGTALAKIPDLRVVARESAFQFKGEKKDVRAIGQSLGATHLIEGSVRKAGNRVRISAELVKADDGLRIWAENYDRELTDVFAIQEDIARAIAGALKIPLGLSQRDTLVSSRTQNVASYEDYLRARAMVRGRGTGGLKLLLDSVPLLEQTVAQDPEYAPSWALLAQAYNLRPLFQPPEITYVLEAWKPVVDESLAKAEAAAQRAIKLDVNNADAYVSLGLTQHVRGKFLLADELYEKAFRIDPGNPDALHWRSELMADVGRIKEALAMRRQLEAIEPFVPIFNSITAEILWLNGMNNEALTILDSLPSNFTTLSRDRAMILASTGRFQDAAAAMRGAPSDYYLPGMVEDAARLLGTAPATRAPARTERPLGFLGFVYVYLGVPERFLDWYEGTVAAGYSVPTVNSGFLWHPAYAPVRKTERFKTITAKPVLLIIGR